MAPASLCGLPATTTYLKSYDVLKHKLKQQKCQGMCDIQSEIGIEWQTKLERFLNALSDQQFETLARVLASSPEPRHRMYLGICAMLPRDVELLQNRRAFRQAGKLILPPLPASSSMTLLIPQWIHRIGFTPLSTIDQVQESRSRNGKSVYVSFSIDDVPGAEDLLLTIALRMQTCGFDLNDNFNTLQTLQRFAGLLSIVSKKLILKWMAKLRLERQGVDQITLDLRKAYLPDGIFLPKHAWLQISKMCRSAGPIVIKILAPTKELETELYTEFGITRYQSQF